MKKIIFAFILFPTVLLSQQVKRDSVFLDDKLVGLVHNEGTTLAAGVTYNNFTVYIDEFVSEQGLEIINTHFSNLSQRLLTKSGGKQAIHIKMVERFEGKTSTQISGFYLKKAGQLKRERNNYILIGSIVSTAAIIIFPPASGVAIFTGFGCLASGIVGIVKDYQANKMIEKSGEALMRN